MSLLHKRTLLVSIGCLVLLLLSLVWIQRRVGEEKRIRQIIEEETKRQGYTTREIEATQTDHDSVATAPIESVYAGIEFAAESDSTGATGTGIFDTHQPIRPTPNQITPHCRSHSETPLAIDATPLQHDSAPVCTFRLPSSVSLPHVYLTSRPNGGAGIGHQFGEWGIGPMLCKKYDLNYIHSEFTRNGAVFEKFLGFGVGEQSEAHMYARYSLVHTVDYHLGSHRTGEYGVSNSSDALRRSVDGWVRARIDEFRIHSPHLFTSNSTYPNTGRTEALYIRINQVATVNPFELCQPWLNLILRQKHCRRSVLQPIEVAVSNENRFNYQRMNKRMNLLTRPRLNESDLPKFWLQPGLRMVEHAYNNSIAYRSRHLVVGVHMRCGKSCFSSYRAAPPTVIRQSIQRMVSVLAPIAALESKQLVFHLFAEPPTNTTAEKHFRPILEWFQVSEIAYETHFYLDSISTFDRLLAADVVLGAQSSFSFLLSYLRPSVHIGVMRGCGYSIQIDKSTGEFDTSKLAEYYRASKGVVPQFRSIDECDSMSEISNEPA